MKTKTRFYLVVLTVIALLAVPLAGQAAAPSPFVGAWQAVGVDGSDIHLTIAGPPSGPFQITWTESSFSFCDGEAGIVRGTGALSEDDPNVLEADLHYECFTTGTSGDLHVVWHYDAATGTLFSRDAMWHRAGQSLPAVGESQIIAHPDDNRLEGWGFDVGTPVSFRIFDADGGLVYQNLVEASYPEWDSEHACVQLSPDYDLKAGDHVWMTDGATVKDLVVANLAITEVNFIDRTVSGIADPYSSVEIECGSDSGEPLFITVEAEGDGNWAVGVPGLTPGVPGSATQGDSDGDLTRVTFVVPRLDLRVSYGDDDWVESFFEAGHTISLTVTGSDKETVKATATVFTAAREDWGGESGFQTQPSDWYPTRPDIQPYDWVLASVDTGQTAEVQIGEISGEIDLQADTIQGAITAPWLLPGAVGVEFLPFGAPEPLENRSAMVEPDESGTYPYSCDWSDEWDIQAGEGLGVAYVGSDGHWVANAFQVPRLDLRVNYGDDWVESFFEAGHEVSLTVTGSDKEMVKATATVVTGPREDWGGEPGFQTQPGDWSDALDIQPGDWVFAAVDTGQIAEVQIGEISAAIDPEANSIQGTVTAPWFTDEVQVDFHPWGGPESAPMKYDSVVPNGEDTFFASWDPEAEWDIQAGQVVGVAYIGLDGQWVANTFLAP